MGEVSYGVADAIKDTFRVQKEELGRIWHDPVFIALAVLLVLVCIYSDVRVARTRRPLTWIGVLFVAGSVLVSHFLCIFPVILGYHGGGLSNDRTRYVADLEIRYSLLFAIMYMVQYILQFLSKKESGIMIYVWPELCVDLLYVLAVFFFCMISRKRFPRDTLLY